MLAPPRDRRRLIERRALDRRLAELDPDLDPGQRRAQVRDILKEAPKCKSGSKPELADRSQPTPCATSSTS
jgi:hypothetical protein